MDVSGRLGADFQTGVLRQDFAVVNMDVGARAEIIRLPRKSRSLKSDSFIWLYPSLVFSSCIRADRLCGQMAHAFSTKHWYPSADSLEKLFCLWR